LADEGKTISLVGAESGAYFIKNHAPSAWV